MDLLLNLYLAVLFVLLTPGVLVSLPPKGGKYLVLVVHAVLFILLWQYTNQLFSQYMGELGLSLTIDNFQNNYTNTNGMNSYNNTGVNNTGVNSYNNTGVNNTGVNNYNNTGVNYNNSSMNNSAM